MNNPTVILNGDQVYCDELIRENARLTIQHEVDRQKMEALERQIEDQAANIASLEAHSYAREDLEELLSDVFLSLWRSREGLDTEKSLKSWLAAVARNRAVDFLRRKKETHPVPDGLPDPAPGPEEQLLQKERIQALERALNALSARDRNLVYRKYYYLQSTARMAAELGLTERAVEGRLYRIRRKLQKQLGGEVL